MDSKRLIQCAIVVIAVSLIVFAYFQLSQPQGKTGNPLDTVPSTTSLVCVIDGMSGSESELQFLRSLLSSANSNTTFASWSETLDQLDALRTNNRQWYDLLQNVEFAFQTSDAFNPDNWSIAIGLSEDFSADELMNVWQPSLPKRDYKGSTLFIGQDINWCLLQKCLVVSPSVAVLEELVIQCDKKNVLSSNEAFAKVYALRSKDVPLHITSRIAENTWLPLEPVFTNEGTLLNGYVFTGNTPPHPLFLAASEGELYVARVLPAQTVFLDALYAAEFDSTWHTLNTYYAGSDAESFWSQAWQDLGDSCQCDLNETLLNWRTGEHGSAVLAIGDSISESIAYLGIADSANAIELLQPLLAAQAVPNDGIYAVAYPMAFQRNLIPSITIEPNYIVQYNGYLFAAATPNPLKLIKNAQRALADTPEFSAFAKQTSKNSGRLVFQTNREIALLPTSLMMLIEGAGPWGISTETSLKGQLLVSIALPIRIKDTPAAQTLVVPEPTEKTVEPSKALDETAQSWQMINHNTNEKETLAHDGKNKLELIDASSKPLWTLDIPGPVLGNVLQLDALKNNKLQMAFATSEGVFLVDRNGNFLPGFPFSTTPEVTSNLLVADYDNTKKYRLIVGTSDGMLLNIGIDGKPTSGWKYQPISDDVIVGIASAKVNGDDMLVTVSKNGSLKILKRTGETKANCNTVLEGFDGKTLDIIPGIDLQTTNIVYSTAKGAKTVSLSVQ